MSLIASPVDTVIVAPTAALVLLQANESEADLNRASSAQSTSRDAPVHNHTSETWQCWFGCGTEYSLSSVRSIRQHFRTCFAQHRPDAALLADDELDRFIHQEQESGHIVTGLRRWKRRRPISCTRPSGDTTATHSDTVTAPSSSPAHFQNSANSIALAPAPFTAFSPSTASTASLTLTPQLHSSSSVAPELISPMSASASWDIDGHGWADMLLNSPPSAQHMARYNRGVLAAFHRLRQQRKAVNTAIRRLVSDVLRKDGSSHPLFTLNDCCVRSCLRPDDCDCDCDSSDGDEPKAGRERDRGADTAEVTDIDKHNARTVTVPPAAAAATQNSYRGFTAPPCHALHPYPCTYSPLSSSRPRSWSQNALSGPHALPLPNIQQ